jgi:hypothetical protein
MKPRVIAPYKILAVALATVSCGKTTAESPQSEAGSVAPGASVASDVPVTPPVPGAGAAPGASSAPVADDKADPKLLLLRAELERETRESALATQAHYRPLCDKDGYPLVGNVIRKGPGAPQPSEVCADVRTKKATPS